MRRPSFFGTLLSILIFFFVLRFAFRLLPYIMIGYLIWYFYRKLIKPFFTRGQEGPRYQNTRRNYQGNPNPKTEQEDPLNHQVKSVHDDQFFQQDHKVIDVDFEDKEE